MYKRCEWCNKIRHITIHHVKDRLGDKEIFFIHGKQIFRTIGVCRPCHDEIERDYELIGKVILQEFFKRESNLDGIRHNLYVRMTDIYTKSSQRETRLWLIKKINRIYNKMLQDKKCRIGLYYEQEQNKQKYRELIMILAIALHDIRYIANLRVV